MGGVSDRPLSRPAAGRTATARARAVTAMSSVLSPGTLRHVPAASGCICFRASGRTPAPAITACAAAGQGAGGVADLLTKVLRFSTQVLVAQMNFVVSA